MLQMLFDYFLCINVVLYKRTIGTLISFYIQILLTQGKLLTSWHRRCNTCAVSKVLSCNFVVNELSVKKIDCLSPFNVFDETRNVPFRSMH